MKRFLCLLLAACAQLEANAMDKGMVAKGFLCEQMSCPGMLKRGQREREVSLWFGLLAGACLGL